MEFLLHVLKVIDFHEKWINHIQECVIAIFYFLIINEDDHGYFKPNRGIL